MAVSSINNKKRGNNSNNKYYNSKQKQRIKKDIYINELINGLEEVIKIKENTIVSSNKSSNKKYYYIFILLLIILLIYFLIPKITLKGNKEVIINYNEEYVEAGYKAKFLFIDITDNIKIKNNIKRNKVGNYNIDYFINLGIVNFKKTRKVIIIDNIKPSIKVEKDIINICPNDNIPDITFDAIDDYDGNLTDKVIKEYSDDKVILIVRDSSNNEISKEIKIDREDKTKPSITLKGNTTMYLTLLEHYNEPGYIANDNCDGDITNKVVVDGEVKQQVGTYKIKYTVTDSSNNTNEVIRTVIVRNNNLYNNGSIGNGVIYLTFDDGPNNGTTNVILDILKEEGVKATFFVTCNGPDNLIKRIYDEGHTLALHTCTHDYSYVYSSVDNYFNDLNRVSTRVKNITGYDAKIIRFPGGSSNTVSRRYSYGIMSTLTGMVLDKGYRYYDWNVDSKDAGGANSSSQVYNNVVNYLSHNRSNVVLMHDVKYQTRDALRDIIRYAKNNGYTFSKIEMDTYMVRHGVNN